MKDNTKISVILTKRNKSLEHRAKVSNALKGRVFSEDWRNKLSLAKRGIKLTPEHIEKIRQNGLGRKHSEESKMKMSESKRKHREESVDCKCASCFPPQSPTRIHKILLRILSDFPLLEIDKKFGNYCVDVYIPYPYHLAFEADGEYWHNKIGAKEFDKNRDKYLMDNFNLPVIRMEEKELTELAKMEGWRFRK